MSAFVQGEVRADVVQDLQEMASREADVPELVDFLQRRLDLNNANALFPVLIYFRAAFDLSLREVLPLREWLGGKDRSEVDSILVPAIQRTRSKWRTGHLQQA